jgi:hypothetical protein
VPSAFIFAALITPSLDGTLTFLVALPMLLLYEAGLIAGWLTHPEGGNYFADLPMVQTVRQLMLKVYKKVRSGAAWVLRRPVVMIRWVRWKIWEYGSGWWWD